MFRQAAQAKSVLGVNGALDFGPLAGDQPGGEGTGKVSGESWASIDPTGAICVEERLRPASGCTDTQDGPSVG